MGEYCIVEDRNLSSLVSDNWCCVSYLCAQSYQTHLQSRAETVNKASNLGPTAVLGANGIAGLSMGFAKMLI
jgi:hypothetical protein